MKEELISLETARLAKEKGFSVGTNGCLVHYKKENKHPHDGTSGPFGWEKDEISFDSSYIVNGREDLGDLSCKSYDCFERPSQLLLKMWLWEKYKIWVEVTLWGDGIGFTCLIKQAKGKEDDDSTIVKQLKLVDTGLTRSEPSKVLEKGLQEALKLI